MSLENSDRHFVAEHSCEVCEVFGGPGGVAVLAGAAFGTDLEGGASDGVAG